MTFKWIAVLLLPIGMAHGQTAIYNMTNPVGLCDGALPSQDAKLRKRPTAFANEGTSTAFVSCSLTHPWTTPATEPFYLNIFVKDPSRTQNVTMSCTLVAGTTGAEAPTPLYYTLSQTFADGTSNYRRFEWNAADYGLTSFRHPMNVSCALPPGIEVNDITGGYQP